MDDNQPAATVEQAAKRPDELFVARTLRDMRNPVNWIVDHIIDWESAMQSASGAASRRHRFASPLKLIGAKTYLARWICDRALDRIPHAAYIEAFGGSGAVMFAKKPVPCTIWNDIDSGVYNFFKVVRDPELCSRLIARLVLTPLCREGWVDAKQENPKYFDCVEAAARLFVKFSQSFSASGNGWMGPAPPAVRRGMDKNMAVWFSRVQCIPKMCLRLRNVTIENLPYESLIERYDKPKYQSLFYLDPPYVPGTRSKKIYQHEVSLQWYDAFVARAMAIQSPCVISGYDSPSMRILEDGGWKVLRKAVSTHSGVKPGRPPARKTECLWLNPPAYDAAFAGQLELFPEPNPATESVND